MSGVTTGTTVGNYFELNGGYLQGFFKIQDENYEMLPPRYGEGITIENIIRIDEDSSGIFYLMGARAEDKYNPFFSGETELVIKTSTETVRTGIVGQTREVTTTVTGFSGVTTSKLHYLNAFLDEEVRKKAFSDFQNAFEVKPIEQPKDATFENLIAFELTSDKRLQIKRVNEEGTLVIKTSTQIIPTTGWTIITHVFTPDDLITDPEELKCADRRLGTLTFYVNGRKFWTINDYTEYYFVDVKNDSEKVIGLPYNISWGGGSFGLKHSWHYDIETYSLYSGESTSYIDSNFVVKHNPLDDDPCLITGATGGTGSTFGTIVLSADSTTFSIPNECDSGTTAITVMDVQYTGTTAQTPSNEYYFEFVDPIELISNRDYDFNFDIYDVDLFNVDSRGKVSIIVYGTEDFEIVEELPYEKPAPSTDRTNNMWVNVHLKGKVKDNTKEQTFRVGILFESTMPFNDGFNVFIKDFKYRGSDILNQDSTKDNLLVQQNFDSSYIGGIQKLRIYDIAFNSQEVLHNAKYESINNPEYGLMISGGGRIIYT
jgi:hypothetical protein